MKVYLIPNSFTKSEVEKFTKKQCEKFSIASKPIEWLENYLNSDVVGLDLYIRIY